MPRISRANFPLQHNVNKDFKPKISDVEYKHSIVSSKDTPKSALLTQIEGTRITVDYFSQILGRDEEPSTFDYYKDGVNQQYLYIKNLELLMQSELSTSTDTSDQTQTITSTAIVYPYHKPNVGDIFILDIGNGQAGLFSVVEVEKKSMFKESVYEINFVMADYLNADLESKIKQKVVKETEFVKDFMLYGQNPIIASTDKLKLDKLTDLKEDVLADWLTEFYSVEFKTILVPNQVPTYDPFVIDLLAKIFNKYEHPLLNNIVRYNVDDQNLNYHNDIWEVLVEREPYMLRSCFSKIEVVSTKDFIRNPFLQSAYWSGISKVIFPVKTDFYTDDKLGLTTKLTGTGGLVDTPSLESEFTLPDISDKSYVFNSSFYTNTYSPNLSTLEYLVHNYLNEKANDWRIIAKALEERHNWSRLKRFYNVPVLLILVISEIRSI